jgi:SAM-dependent methyltransferase
LGEVLEVGCGTGEFTRLLAERCERVVAVDLSPRMIETARARSKDHPNVEYPVADAASWEFPSERFDCAASIATLHHLPLGPMLAKMRDALKPGGPLLLLDLYRARTAADRLVSALAVPISKAIRLARTGSLAERQAPELQKPGRSMARPTPIPPLPRYAAPARPSYRAWPSGGDSFGVTRSCGTSRCVVGSEERTSENYYSTHFGE